MDIGSLLVILALLLLVGLFISRPLLERKEIRITSADILEDHEHSALLAERDRILTSLEELDFDYAVGKIPAEDYPILRRTLVQKGADVLRALDKYESEVPEQEIDTRLESAIAARRTMPAGVTDPSAGDEPYEESSLPARASNHIQVDDEIETLIATRRRQRSDKSAGFCPQCGNAVTQSDRFCSKCGTALS
jgi:hypothetical protein